MDNLPLVSIVVITYNQEKTIFQTLDSILSQNIDFLIEIIVGEDCSSDKTRKICNEYKDRHPDIIKLILHEQNQGLLKNYNSVIELCRGKYIAQCSGDDYWHNPDKLKLQVEFLEKNPDYGLVHSNADILFVKRNKIKKIYRDNVPQGYIFKNLLEEGNHIWALSVLFRQELLNYVDFDEYIKQGFMMEDYPMWLELAKRTKIYYMNISTATYRYNVNSASVFDDYSKSITFAENLNKIRRYFYSKYSNNIDFEKIEQQYYVEHWHIAYKFNIQKDIVFYAKYLPNKTIIQKIKKHLLKYKLLRFIFNELKHLKEKI
jgi:glycosyltransferase involved in cell wall biosynthesis